MTAITPSRLIASTRSQKGREVSVKRSRLVPAGAVHDHLGAALLALDRRRERGHGARVGDVHLIASHRRGDTRLFRRGPLAGAKVCAGDGVAELGQPACARAADPRRRAGDEREPGARPARKRCSDGSRLSRLQPRRLTAPSVAAVSGETVVHQSAGPAILPPRDRLPRIDRRDRPGRSSARRGSPGRPRGRLLCSPGPGFAFRAARLQYGARTARARCARLRRG